LNHIACNRSPTDVFPAKGSDPFSVVGHQHVGVHPTALAHQCLVQPTKVGTPVLVAEEARPAVVAALHDVQR
jgi:hypothetical protein